MNPTIFVLLSILQAALISGDFLESTLKNVVYENAYQLNVSETCSGQLQAFVGALQEVDFNNMWAWKMIDATAKLQTGILEGNMGDLGHFDECINTSANSSVGHINGKYCLGTLSFGSSSGLVRDFFEKNVFLQDIAGRSPSSASMGLQYAACLPDGCTGDDFEKIYSYISEEYLKGILTFKFSEESCQTIEDTRPPLTTGAITAITIFSIILALVALSTIYDLYLQYYTKSKPPYLILVAFSAYTNADKLFAMAPNKPDMMPCLNGLRVISMMWVMIGHQYPSFGLLYNALYLMDWFKTWHSMYIRGATVAVDTFFVLSGLLMTYGFMKAKSKGTPFNVFFYWIHRYLRLTPALAAVILLQATLTKYLGDGPLWTTTTVDSMTKNCQEYWWSALLYIQNYVNVEEICMGQSWYLSVDMQLFILSPLILIPLWKWKKKGLALLFLLMIVSVVVPFVIAWEYNLASSYVHPSNIIQGNKDFSTKYYLVTHTRATPWLIGVLLGYAIFITKTKKSSFKLNRIVVLVLWAASLSVLTTCVFAGYDTMMKEEYEKWPNVSYVVFVRPAWAIALSWLIFACVTGNGGCINWFLSFPVYQVLARLTYSAYLLHMLVMFVKSTSNRVPEYFADYVKMYDFWGSTMFTCALSVVWVLAFESPMITIEKVLFGGAGKRRQQPNDKSTEKTVEEV